MDEMVLNNPIVGEGVKKAGVELKEASAYNLYIATSRSNPNSQTEIQLSLI